MQPFADRLHAARPGLKIDFPEREAEYEI